MSDLWTEATYDAEAEKMSRLVVSAKVAVAEHVPFLTAATSAQDYANRKALITDRLDQAVATLLPNDPVGFGVVRSSLETSLDEDYRVVAAARAEEARVAALETAQRRQAQHQAMQAQARRITAADFQKKAEQKTAGRYEVKKDSVHSYWGIWDTQESTWHEGDYSDAVEAAGIPMWDSEAKARAKVESLNSTASKKTAASDGDTSNCKHCGRPIVFRSGEPASSGTGMWIDEAAGYDDENGDGIWRETCDSHDTFTAEHEPATASKKTAGENPFADKGGSPDPAAATETEEKKGPQRQVDLDPETQEWVGSEWEESEDPATLVQSASTFGKNPRFKTEEEANAWAAGESETADTTKPDAVPGEQPKPATAAKTAALRVRDAFGQVWISDGWGDATQDPTTGEWTAIEGSIRLYNEENVGQQQTITQSDIDSGKFTVVSAKTAAGHSETCSTCHGTGQVASTAATSDTQEGYSKCSECNGTGSVWVEEATASKTAGYDGWGMQDNPNFPGEKILACPKCGGFVTMTGTPLSDPYGQGTTLTCQSCGFSQFFNQTNASKHTAEKMVRGTDLSPAARAEVLSSYVHRWTSDNPQRVTAWGPCSKCDIRDPYVNTSSSEGHSHPTMPLVSDEEWLASHQFKVRNDGSISGNSSYAEPFYASKRTAAEDHEHRWTDWGICGVCNATKDEVKTQESGGFFASKTASWSEQARSVVTNHQFAEVDGMILDATTASMLVQILDALSADNKAKFEAMPLAQAVDFGWKLLNKATGSRLPFAREASEGAWGLYVTHKSGGHVNILPEARFADRDDAGRAARLYGGDFKGNAQISGVQVKRYQGESATTTFEEFSKDPSAFAKNASRTAAQPNPYSTPGNPYVPAQQPPGTPDDVLDGPTNPAPVTLDMPKTTRPRQMPSGDSSLPTMETRPVARRIR